MTADVSSGSARRFKKRRFTRRLLRLRPVLILAAIVLVVGAVVWVVGYSTVLDVRAVSVRGLPASSPLTSDDVVSAAAVGTGGPLARVDLAAARSRVLGKLPALASAEVSRSWPHTVLVEVKERSAVAVLSDGGLLRLVDASGVAFRTVPARPAGLPVVTLSAFGDSRQRTLQAAAGVVAGLPPALKGRLVSVSARTADSVTLRLTGEVTVMWGSATDADKKARVLAALLKQGAKEYDVSVPDLPTTKA